MAVGLVRAAGLRSAAAAGGGVQPTVVRSAEIGTTTTIATPWTGSGTFDTTGTEPNRILLVFLMPFDTANAAAMSATSMTIGGTNATLGVDFIAPTGGGSRNLSTAIYYRLAPAASSTLAVAWSIASTSTLSSGKVVGVLLRDVHQTSPMPSSAQVNWGNNASGALQDLDLTWTTSFLDSLLIGGFSGRGGDTHPMVSRNSSTVIYTAQSGTNTTSDSGHGISTLPGGAVGSKTLSIRMNSADAYGGTAVELRAA